jgi:ubiquinone/menaquinone biosynthesis C-methylase UbiE
VNDYEIETEEYLKNGIRLFQAHLLGSSELEHVVSFYHLCLPRGVGVDMGCGIGEMGHLLRLVDPSLTVIGVTNCKAQSAYMRSIGREHIVADYHTVPLEDAVADFVMFNESIGYADLDKVLAESARLLKKDGKLLIRDFCNTTSTTEPFYLKSWCYTQYPINVLVDKAATHNMVLNFFMKPKTNFERFKKVLLSSKLRHWHDDSDESNYDLKMTPMLCSFSKL